MIKHDRLYRTQHVNLQKFIQILKHKINAQDSYIHFKELIDIVHCILDDDRAGSIALTHSFNELNTLLKASKQILSDELMWRTVDLTPYKVAELKLLAKLTSAIY